MENDDIADAEDDGPDAQSGEPNGDDLFGIDLGPKYARDQAEPDETPAPAPVRQPTRSLTDRLADAASDRVDSERTTEEEPSTRE